METKVKPDYSELASYTGRLFRDNFGKGPQSVYVSIEHPVVTIYLRDFLAPMERVLDKQKNKMKIEETRDLLMQELIPDIKAQVRIMLETDVESVYYDWSIDNRSGLIICILKDAEDVPFPDYEGKERIHEQINQLSIIAEKAPEEIASSHLNDRTLIIRRTGILVEIEKEMIRSGFSEQLRLAKRRLEKRLLETSVFETILESSVVDRFVDWDFDKDRSYIVLILKPR
ncbi:Na-translocating system protein MpsC family protein [Alteribacter lacisalsi]|uniref:Na-translocating system protein MpsC family protein n=1 Tax=Alteribacter lacisalsi TaxID=2045244 RepID=UPI001F1C75CF|nr:Na-translocating system protein MpsC family protein [Alteribacter lacisalsi]